MNTKRIQLTFHENTEAARLTFDENAVLDKKLLKLLDAKRLPLDESSRFRTVSYKMTPQQQRHRDKNKRARKARKNNR